MFLLTLLCVLSFAAIVHNEKVKRESSGNILMWIIARQLDRVDNKLLDMQKQYNSRDAEIESMKKTIQRQNKELRGKFLRMINEHHTCWRKQISYRYL